MNKAIVFFDHIADVLFEARGSTFTKALENSAKAMFQTIADINRIKKTDCFKISVKASTQEDLVVSLLSELLVEGENRELFLKSFKIDLLQESKEGFKLSGEACGSPFNPRIGRVGVKAVTYHELSVTQTKRKCVIRVLLDI